MEKAKDLSAPSHYCYSKKSIGGYNMLGIHLSMRKQEINVKFLVAVCVGRGERGQY
jgi:hypothetical protein